MDAELRALLDSVRGYRPAPAEREEQLVAFAAGNLRIDEPRVPRDMVAAAVRAALARGCGGG